MIDSVLRPPRLEDQDELKKWLRKDKTVRMTIRLTLSDEMLKNLNHAVTALEMWKEICNVHQRHTLLNKLAARRVFYTATMKDGEKILVCINRVRQMASVLESMDVSIDGKEMAMAILNGLPKRYQTIIIALDAIGDDDPTSLSTRFAVVFYKKRNGTLCGRTLHIVPTHQLSLIARQSLLETEARSTARAAENRITQNRIAGNNTGAPRAKEVVVQTSQGRKS